MRTVIENFSGAHANTTTVDEFLLRMIPFHFLRLEVDGDEGTPEAKAFLWVLVVVPLPHAPRPVAEPTTARSYCVDLSLNRPDECIEHAVLHRHPFPDGTVPLALRHYDLVAGFPRSGVDDLAGLVVGHVQGVGCGDHSVSMNHVALP